jgi:hypothetical protein
MNDASRCRLKVSARILASLAALILCAGCASLGGGQEQPTVETSPAPEAGPLTSDFQDIRLPRELKEVKNETFFMQTGTFSAGVLTLRGRVEVNSLIAFFETQMRADNWQLVGFFRSTRSLMMFYKENRWCVINITEKHVYTYVELWVAPTLRQAETRLLN